MYDAICFHTQQCVEKYRKAWLTERQATFPRTHDLEMLARLCLPSFGELLNLMPELRFLTSFAVEIRYPGTTALRSDAERCLRVAREVRRAARITLGIEHCFGATSHEW